MHYIFSVEIILFLICKISIIRRKNMIYEAVFDKALALLLKGSDYDNRELEIIIRCRLLAAGIEPWSSMECESFTYSGNTLIIARAV